MFGGLFGLFWPILNQYSGGSEAYFGPIQRFRRHILGPVGFVQTVPGAFLGLLHVLGLCLLFEAHLWGVRGLFLGLLSLYREGLEALFSAF